MLNCPECNTKQSKLKVMGLTNFNSIICPRCCSQLKANKLINSLIGGVGGGSGAFIGALLISNPGSEKLWLSLAFWLSFLVLAQLKFTKLHVSKT